MTTRERMARALFGNFARRSLPLEPDVKWEEQEDFRKQQILYDVDTVLDVLTEPSDGVLEAMFEARDIFNETTNGTTYFDQWGAMIRAIRNNK